MFTEIGDTRHEHLKMSRISGGELLKTQWPHCVFGVGSSISNQMGNKPKSGRDQTIYLIIGRYQLDTKVWQGSNGEADREQTYRLEGRVQDEWRESSMERYTLSCKIAGGNLVYHSGNSNQGSVTTYGGRVEGGREAQLEGDICIPVADPCWRMAETNIIL